MNLVPKSMLLLLGLSSAAFAQAPPDSTDFLERHISDAGFYTNHARSDHVNTISIGLFGEAKLKGDWLLLEVGVPVVELLETDHPRDDYHFTCDWLAILPAMAVFGIADALPGDSTEVPLWLGVPFLAATIAHLSIPSYHSTDLALAVRSGL